jgi:hypothetical protein
MLVLATLDWLFSPSEERLGKRVSCSEAGLSGSVDTPECHVRKIARKTENLISLTDHLILLND